MWNKKILIWISVLFLLFMPIVFSARTDTEMFDAAILLNRCEGASILTDDSNRNTEQSFSSGPTSQDSTNFQEGSASCSHADGNPSDWIDADIGPTVNWTNDFWLRRPTADGDQMYFAGNQDDGTEDGFWRIRLDPSTPAQLIWHWEGDTGITYNPSTDIFTGNHFNHICLVLNQTDGIAYRERIIKRGGYEYNQRTLDLNVYTKYCP
ncbi:hypothetical protein LCGC14_2598080 [marine sediment metagenome]|uniref:Uncharacterized protein n=1 Tax=marine sediment metagenome TaxID=412755 RepID=A0A0F9A9M8_9ZZZZ